MPEEEVDEHAGQHFNQVTGNWELDSDDAVVIEPVSGEAAQAPVAAPVEEAAPAEPETESIEQKILSDLHDRFDKLEARIEELLGKDPAEAPKDSRPSTAPGSSDTSVTSTVFPSSSQNLSSPFAAAPPEVVTDTP